MTGDSFSLFLPWVNTEMMNLYLAEMSVAFPDKKILLIWDQAGWHKAKSLKVPENIILKSLPPYSPELNPVEKLWQWLMLLRSVVQKSFHFPPFAKGGSGGICQYLLRVNQ